MGRKDKRKELFLHKRKRKPKRNDGMFGSNKRKLQSYDGQPTASTEPVDREAKSAKAAQSLLLLPQGDREDSLSCGASIALNANEVACGSPHNFKMAGAFNEQTTVRIYPASSHIKCVVRCCGKLKKDHPNISFFRIPQTGEKRRKWLEAVSRSDLTQNDRCYEVCSDHFEPHMIRNLKLLKPNAEPTIKTTSVNDIEPTTSINEVQLLQTIDIAQACSSKVKIKYEPDYDITLEPDNDINDIKLEPNDEPDIKTEPNDEDDLKSEPIDECRLITNDATNTNTKQTQTDRDTESQSVINVYKRELLKTLETKYAERQEYALKIKYLEQEIQKLKQDIAPKEMLQPNDEFTKKLTELFHWNKQMKAKYRDKRYTTEFKYFALNLYISSRHLYTKLTSSLDLPSVSYLKKLQFHIPSMLNEQTLNCLSNKLKSMPDKAKYCSLSIATIDLKQHLYYNITRDEIIGLHNINGDVAYVVANTVYYVMLRGIAIDWKQPVAYAFFADKTLFTELDKWLKYVIMKLSYLGFQITAISSSLELHLIQFAEFKSVSVEQPFITVNGNKIYYIFDAPQMLTSLRNYLINNDFYQREIQRISWSHIETLYAYKKKNLLNVLPKLTESHISPNVSESKEVKYAAQIFSNSVYSTFDILMAVNYIPKEAKPTAQFVKTINDLFDILNSNKLKCDIEYQSALTLSHIQLKTLKHAQHVFQELRVINKNRKAIVTKEHHVFKAMQITIKAIILLASTMIEFGIKKILTRRLNNEPSKCLKKTPHINRDGILITSITFVKMFSEQFFIHILQNVKNEKFQGDVCELLMKAELICNSTGIAQSEGTPVLLSGDHDYRFQLPKHNAFTYVSSYLLFKCSLQHLCPDFDEMLTQCSPINSFDDINQSCTFSGRLRVPLAPFNNYVRKLDDRFNACFYEAVKSNPARMMLGFLSEVTYFDSPCKCFPTDYLLTLFIRLKIYSILKNNMTFIGPLRD